MKLREIYDMIFDMIDVHIGGVQITKTIFVSFERLEDEVVGFCEISNSWEQANLVFNMFELDEADTEDQIDIVCHELAHLICEEKTQSEDDVISSGHDELWQEVTKAIGGRPCYY